MAYCNNCGNQIPDGATFCDKCGATTSAPPVQQPQNYAQQPLQYAQPQQPMAPPQYPQQPMQQPMQPQYGGQPAPYAPQGGYYTAQKSKMPLIIVLIVVGVIGIALAIILPIVLSGNGGGNNNGGGNGGDPLVGNWHIDLQATADLYGASPDEMAELSGMVFDLSLRSDNTFSMNASFAGETIEAAGTWSKSGSSLTFSNDYGNGFSYVYSLENGKLKLSMNGSSVYLTK